MFKFLKQSITILLFFLVTILFGCIHSPKTKSQLIAPEYSASFSNDGKSVSISFSGFFNSIVADTFTTQEKALLTDDFSIDCTKGVCTIQVFNLAPSSYSKDPFFLRVDFSSQSCNQAKEIFRPYLIRSTDQVLEFLLSTDGQCFIQIFDSDQFSDPKLDSVLSDFLNFKNQKDLLIKDILAGELSIGSTQAILASMVEVDQKARELWFLPERDQLSSLQKAYFKMKLWPKLLVDDDHLPVLKKLIAKYQWFNISKFGALADTNGWLLVQHMDQDPSFQLKVLKTLEKLYPKKETSPKNYAYLHDRLANFEKRKQKYGTQGKCVGKGEWEPHELENPKKVDYFRKKVGLPPMSEYKAGFINICY